MGISVDLWRQRIGRCSHYSMRNGSDSAPLRSVLCLSLLFQILSVLLIIGNIELNPGPPMFRCSFCEKDFNSLLLHASHQKIHRVIRNFSFSCGWPLCQHNFSTLTGLLTHINSLHAEAPVPQSSENLNSCSFLGCTTIPKNLNELCQHTFTHIREGAGVKCPIASCESKTVYQSSGTVNAETAVKRLRIHLSSYHSGWKSESVSAAAVTSTSQVTDVGENIEFSMDLDTECAEDSDQNDIDIKPTFEFIAKFYLELEAAFFLPQSTVQAISDRMTVLSELLRESLMAVLEKEMKALGLKDDAVSHVVTKVLMHDVLYCAHHKNTPGPTFTSDYLRMDYAAAHFNYVKPTEILLGDDPHSECYLHHVPIKNTLERLFEDSSIIHFIEESFKQKVPKEQVYEDYTDGEVFKNRPRSNEERIDLILFQDGFTLTNPLGSAKKLYKFIGCYFTIGNLPSYCRSKLDAIHLTLLFNEIVKQWITVADCFSPVLEELKALYTEGVNFNGRKVPVVLQFVVGDNLGSHWIGGFLENFSKAIYFCRFCEIMKVEFEDNCCHIASTRTPESYNAALHKLQRKQQVDHNIKSIKGIKASCPFNDLPYFHACDPGLPVCLAHDLFEGVVNYDLAEMINHFVEEGWFTYARLTKIIDKFLYKGSDCGNKPSMGINESSLRGHAVQNWTLLRLLPLLIEGKVKDVEDKFWKLYLNLKSVVDFACSPRFTAEDLSCMDQAVKCYLKKREEILQKPKPKHHYLLHYVSLIPLFGPLIHLWTLRFESKHAFLKRISRACRNFINLGKTLSQRHQLYLSYLHTGVCFNLQISDPQSLSMSQAHKMSSDKVLQSFLRSKGISLQLQFLHSVIASEIKYRNGDLLLLGCRASRNLELGIIKCMYNDGGDVVFVLQRGVGFEWPEYGLYKIVVAVESDFVLQRQSDLRYPVPHPSYDFQDYLCLSLKHKLSLIN